MTTSLLHLLFLSAGPISIPAGYYTLAEVAGEVSKAGVQIRAETTVAGDIYAIRLKGIEWKELRPALEADGRLSMIQRDGVWRIGRSSVSFNQESAALKRYLAAAAKTIHSVYGEAERKIRALQALPEAERSKASADALDEETTDPIKTRVKHLVYLNGGNELPFGIIAAASAFTSPAQPPRFGQTFLTTVFENPGLLLPSGNIRYLKLPGGRTMTEPELVEFARSTSLALKIVMDPLTLNCGVKMLAAGGVGNGLSFFSGSNEEISPPLTIKIDPAEVWTRDELADQNRRIALTEETLKPSRYAESASLPKMPIASSAALLKCAESMDTQLVSYVAPFSDVVQSGLNSMRDVIAGKNLDLARVRRSLAERAEGVYARELKLPLQIASRFTAEFHGPVLVVRDEMRFLSGLAQAGSPSAAILNVLVREKPVKLDDLVENVAKLDFKRWTNSFFSSNYLSFCNPVSFRPFALMLQKSPTLRRKISALEEGKPVTVLYGEFEVAATTALHAGIVESAPHNDSGMLWGNPALVSQLLAPREGQAPKIRLERKQGLVELRMIHNGETKWRTWVENVDVSDSRPNTLSPLRTSASSSL